MFTAKDRFDPHPLTRNEAVLHANLWLFKSCKICAKVVQSHFKHGGQNAQQDMPEKKTVFRLVKERTGILDDMGSF